MNHVLKTCKHHWVGNENTHWGRTAERRPFMPSGTPPRFARDAPVVGRHLRVELHLEPEAERAWGSTTHQLEVLGNQVEAIHFDAMHLEISRVLVGRRRTEFHYDGARLTVTLPKPLSRGATQEVTIEHAVTQPRAGLYFTNPDPAYPDRFQTVWTQGQDEDSRYYLPCLDAPRFKQSTEALLHVPEGWFALSNGTLVSHKPAGKSQKDGGGLWHYRLDLPCSTYLFSIVAGRFDRHSERHGKVDIRWFHQPGRAQEARNAFGNTGRILEFLAGFTGVPYPHAQYTQIAVPDFIFGGMENYTVTTQTDLTLHDDRAHLDFSSDDLVAHEAAHTWFGNLVTARNWDHAWLHESFATYMESCYLGATEGEAEREYQLLRDAEAYFHEDGQYRRPLVTNRYEEPIDLFDAHLYPGGAVRLRNLHSLLGDAPFRAVLRRYLESHRDGVAETVDLARAVEAEAGENYDWWFDQWIFNAGYPDLEISHAWKDKEQLAEVVIKQRQHLVEDGVGTGKNGKPAVPRYFHLPSTLLFQTGRQQHRFPVTVQGAETRFLVRLERRPDMVLFDPDYAQPVKKVRFEKSDTLLITQLRQAPGVVSRIEAAEALGGKSSTQVLEALARQLRREPFWGVQQRIARALGRIGGEAARDALLRAINLPHPKARREVVAVLGHFRDDPKVGRALAAKVRKGDDSYFVEAEAIRSLGRVRAAEAESLLPDLLARDSHLEVIRTAVYNAYGELRLESSWPLLRAGMAYGAPVLARGAAMAAAVEMVLRHPHLRQEVLEALSHAAEHRGQPAAAFRGKMAALRALGNIQSADALPILSRMASQAVDGRIARQARLNMADLRKRLTRPQELDTLREDLERGQREGRALVARVETLEQTRQQPASGSRNKAPKKGSAGRQSKGS